MIKPEVNSHTPIENIKYAIWDLVGDALGQAEAEERRNRPRGTKRNKVPIVCGDILEAPDRRMRGTRGTSGKVHCECTVLEILGGDRLRVRWGDGTESKIQMASARRKQHEPALLAGSVRCLTA